MLKLVWRTKFGPMVRRGISFIPGYVVAVSTASSIPRRSPMLTWIHSLG